jgi:hypothetical protein
LEDLVRGDFEIIRIKFELQEATSGVQEGLGLGDLGFSGITDVHIVVADAGDILGAVLVALYSLIFILENSLIRE